jgi:hypothetical protein
MQVVQLVIQLFGCSVDNATAISALFFNISFMLLGTTVLYFCRKIFGYYIVSGLLFFLVMISIISGMCYSICVLEDQRQEIMMKYPYSG